MSAILASIGEFVALGGPVLVILMLVSIAALALFIAKYTQFRRAGVGKHGDIRKAIDLWDAGREQEAQKVLAGSDYYLGQIMTMAVRLEGRDRARQRIEIEAEHRFMDLERGFRFLDIVVQLAPLLGLFGTVLGMIEAFQALQGAGSQVDPSILAGGIWVALMTTAAGLAVAMPASMALVWLESRIDGERALAELAVSVIAVPLPNEDKVVSVLRKAGGLAAG